MVFEQCQPNMKQTKIRSIFKNTQVTHICLASLFFPLVTPGSP